MPTMSTHVYSCILQKKTVGRHVILVVHIKHGTQALILLKLKKVRKQAFSSLIKHNSNLALLQSYVLNP
jgi:hypothetical protein